MKTSLKPMYSMDHWLLDRIAAKYPGHAIHATSPWDGRSIGLVPDGWDGLKVVSGYAHLDQAPEASRPFLTRDVLVDRSRVDCDRGDSLTFRVRD